MERGKTTWLLVFVISILTVLIISGYYYEKSESNEIRAHKYSELHVISLSKEAQIKGWLNTQKINCEIITRSPFYVEAVSKLLKKSNPAKLSEDLIERNSVVKELYDFEDILLLSVDGKLLATTQKNTYQTNRYVKQNISKILETKKTVFTSLYENNNDKKILLDLYTPVKDKKDNVIAILVCKINPNLFLFPLIQSWPTESKTAETLLIGGQRDSVVFLNKLRHINNVPLKMKFPLSQKDLPAARVVLGYVGIFEGSDYRGVSVLADLNPLEGTNWKMITKVDMSEIFADLHYRTIVTYIVLILISALFSILVFAYHRSSQKDHFEKLYHSEKELRNVHEEFRTTLYSIGDGVISTDVNGNIKQMNAVAERMTGFSESESVGKSVHQVFKIINEYSRESVVSPVQKVLEEGLIVGLANHTLLISKDGSETPIADSGAPIKDETGETQGVVLVFRDQTEERKAQKEIENNAKKFLDLFTNMSEGVALHSLVLDNKGNPINYKIIDVNPQYENIIGVNRLDIIYKLATDAYNLDEPPFLSEYAQVALTGIPTQMKIYFPPLEKHFEISVAPWTENGFATIFTDITSRVRNEEAIQKKIIALTQPLGNTSNISFSELFNLSDIQKIQDSFSSATGVASVITDIDGFPITQTSNFCNLCQNVIRKTSKGLSNCYKSDAELGKHHPEGPIIQQCLSGGLWDAGASITIGGKHIANWLIGQVRDEDIDEEKFLLYADEIGADRNEFKAALAEVPVMSKEKFSKIADSLFVLANELSLKAYQNIQQARFITERKEIENAIREREEKLSVTLNSIGDGVISTDTNGNVTHLNPVAEELTGWKSSEAFGKPLESIFNIINASTREKANNPVWRVLKEGIIVGLANHTALISKDGFERQIADSAAPIKDKEGNIIGVVLVFSDVTKEYQVQEELSQNERLLRESQQVAKIGSYTLDLNTGIWKSSSALNEIFGIDDSYEKSVAGWVGITHPDWQQIMNDYFFIDVVQKKGRFDKEYKIIRKNDGAIRWVHGFGELEYDDQKKPIRMLGTIQDVTDITNARIELEKYKNQLEEIVAERTAQLDSVNARLVEEIQKQKEYELLLSDSLNKEKEMNELKSRFISTVSHEFRTPLMAIQLSSDLLHRYSKNIENEKFTTQINSIKNSINNLTKLLDDVLTINRAEAGKIQCEAVITNLKELIEEIIKEVTVYKKEEHQLVLNYQLNKEQFLLDPKLIRYILMNLLSNAYKYSPEGGKIELNISINDHKLQFTVADNGIGFNGELSEKIFEPFFRAKNALDIPGTGLGLSIVKKSVELHNGIIECFSEFGKGTRFIVKIPT